MSSLSVGTWAGIQERRGFSFARSADEELGFDESNSNAEENVRFRVVQNIEKYVLDAYLQPLDCNFVPNESVRRNEPQWPPTKNASDSRYHLLGDRDRATHTLDQALRPVLSWYAKATGPAALSQEDKMVGNKIIRALGRYYENRTADQNLCEARGEQFLYRRLPNVVGEIYVSTCINHAHLCVQHGDWERANKSIDKAYAKAVYLNYIAIEARCRYWIGVIYHQKLQTEQNDEDLRSDALRMAAISFRAALPCVGKYREGEFLPYFVARYRQRIVDDLEEEEANLYHAHDVHLPTRDEWLQRLQQAVDGGQLFPASPRRPMPQTLPLQLSPSTEHALRTPSTQRVLQEDLAFDTASLLPDDSVSQHGAGRRETKSVATDEVDQTVFEHFSQSYPAYQTSEISVSSVQSSLDLDKELAAAELRAGDAHHDLSLSQVSVLSAVPVALRLSRPNAVVQIANGVRRPSTTITTQESLYGKLMDETQHEVEPKSLARSRSSATLPAIQDQYITKDELLSKYRQLRPKDRDLLRNYIDSIDDRVNVDQPSANYIIQLSEQVEERHHQNSHDSDAFQMSSLHVRPEAPEAIVTGAKALREMIDRHNATRAERLYERYHQFRGRKPKHAIRKMIHDEELQELHGAFGEKLTDPYQLMYKDLSDTEREEERRNAQRLVDRRQRQIAGDVSHNPPDDTSKRLPPVTTSARRLSIPEAALCDTPALDVVATVAENENQTSSVATSDSSAKEVDIVSDTRSLDQMAQPRTPPSRAAAKAGPTSPQSPTYEPATPSPLRKSSLADKEAWWT